ncbi:MAG TPA: MBL fold metallo-hydrolase, partial [Balneolaceae bacterium]|nr:MBL fold metallo-hydrolase [Balneolaceae bacterium]
MIWIISAVLIFTVALFIADKLLAAPKYKDNNSNHFDGKCFVNPDDVGNHHYLEVLKWWFSKNDKGEWPKIAQGDLPQFQVPRQRVSSGDLHITFINHATFLIQVDGLNILTDPIWSNRASPYNWIGPKRQRPPGLKFEDLPPIDLVLISHNHYDHLDLKTVQRLHREHDPQFVVPLGVEHFLNEQGITQNVHLDWWDEYDFNGALSLTAVPARHFSGRGLFDRNKTLWCGYVLHTVEGNIYFAGDSGYGSFFKEIGQRF